MESMMLFGTHPSVKATDYETIARPRHDDGIRLREYNLAVPMPHMFDDDFAGGIA